jgi:hypothetical protein
MGWPWADQAKTFAAALLLGGAFIYTMAAVPATPSTINNFPNLASIRGQAAAGSAAAQTKLGDYFLSAGDATNAVVWYRKAAEQGDPQGQVSLAGCYLQGRGVEKNIAEAARWQRLAAIQNAHKSAASATSTAMATTHVPRIERVRELPKPEATLIGAVLPIAPVAVNGRTHIQRVRTFPEISPKLESPSVSLRPVE